MCGNAEHLNSAAAGHRATNRLKRNHAVRWSEKLGHVVVISNTSYSPNISRQKAPNAPQAIMTMQSSLNRLNGIFGDNLSG